MSACFVPLCPSSAPPLPLPSSAPPLLALLSACAHLVPCHDTQVRVLQPRATQGASVAPLGAAAGAMTNQALASAMVASTAEGTLVGFGGTGDGADASSATSEHALVMFGKSGEAVPQQVKRASLLPVDEVPPSTVGIAPTAPRVLKFLAETATAGGHTGVVTPQQLWRVELSTRAFGALQFMLQVFVCVAVRVCVVCVAWAASVSVLAPPSHLSLRRSAPLCTSPRTLLSMPCKLISCPLSSKLHSCLPLLMASLPSIASPSNGQPR